MAVKTNSALKLKTSRQYHDLVDSTVGIAPVSLTPAASVTITKGDHSGRLLLIPSTATANDEYVLPLPEVAGETYNFCWSGIAIDSDDILFVAPSADALTFSGGILNFNTAEAGAAIQTIAYPGAANDKLQITNVQNFNLTFTATSTTSYHVTGYTASTDTDTAFGDL